MKKFELLAATALVFYAVPAAAQEQTPPEQAGQSDVQNSSTTTPQNGTTAQPDTGVSATNTSNSTDQNGIQDIIVTAQRTSERLQDVPISISAFTGKALETQQIHNSLDLQQSLPNITFTKTNFTGASFTIRGIGDLCTGTSCDQATGIAINDVPAPATRLFETEYLDLERVEVLRGPQGTLFGRNATSGVVNFITARPDLSGIHASGNAEYSNYNSYKVSGVFNLPLTDTIGIRVAGLYLNRRGYTHNNFDDSDIDGRDLYEVRGSLRWQPTSTTTIDIIGSYFKEKDDRSRIQKQLCHRDPTGILGCQPDRLANDTVNGNATFAGILSSKQFIDVGVSSALDGFALRSLYGPGGGPNENDSFSQFVQPTNIRTVNSNVNPTYFTDEINVQGHLDQDFGNVALSILGGYSRTRIESTTGYFLNVPNSLAGNPGIAAFQAPAPFNPLAPVFANANKAIFDSSGNLCASDADLDYTGVFGGNILRCSDRPINYDNSRGQSEGYSVEAHLNSKFDGPFNFLLGGIYLHGDTSGDYLVVQSEGNYVAALTGIAQSLVPANNALGITPGSVYTAPPFFNSEVNEYRLDSYGIFGETYFAFTDKFKLTLGARYSHDKKFIRDRNPLLNFLVPYGTTNAFDSPFVAAADFDASTPGNQVYRNATVQFGRLTGRVVLDWKFRPNSLLFASYSRGYKSGGINPPFNPTLFSAPATFLPESIDAFEIGTKNTFDNGTFQLNASAFYYRYKDLQLSRILNRTSFNDNTDADVYGAEVEAIVRPSQAWLFNLSASYLKTKIKDFSLVDTRDPSGGRSDVVIIKDVTTASNCAVIPTTPGGNGAAARGFVSAVNAGINAATGANLQGPVPVPGTNATGAYSVCSQLAGAIIAAGLPFQLNASGNGVPDGVAIDLRGNELPNAPKYKFSAGAQYTLNLGRDMNIVTRGDLTYTGEYFSRSFNRSIDKIPGYEVVNVSMQLNGPDDRWYLRGFVQNLTADDAITGQYVTDPSTGLFTNVFTLEPRRYGVGVGFKF